MRENLTRVVEDYLKTIYELTRSEQRATTNQIAEKMGVTKEEWNAGAKMPILTLFANKVIQENKHHQ